MTCNEAAALLMSALSLGISLGLLIDRWLNAGRRR